MDRIRRDAVRWTGTLATEDWEPYRQILDDIYSEIWRLRSNTPTVVRAVDLYVPILDLWRKAGVEVECTQNMESWSSVIREAAESSNATMVSLYDLCNGPEHDQIPPDGYLGPG